MTAKSTSFGCLLLVTSYEAKLIDCVAMNLGAKLNCLCSKQSITKENCVSKGVGSTRKRVHPNVAQQYIPGDDSRYTVIYSFNELKMGKLSCWRLSIINLFRKNDEERWRRINPFINRGNQTTQVVKPKKNQTFDRMYVYTQKYCVEMIKNTFLLSATIEP